MLVYTHAAVHWSVQTHVSLFSGLGDNVYVHSVLMRRAGFSALEHRCYISDWDSWGTARHRTVFICTQASETVAWPLAE